MELEEKILTILKETERLKVNDIASKINDKYSENIDSRAVNQILYYRLKGKVYQDNNYYWSLERQGHERRHQEAQIYNDSLLAREDIMFEWHHVVNST